MPQLPSGLLFRLITGLASRENATLLSYFGPLVFTNKQETNHATAFNSRPGQLKSNPTQSQYIIKRLNVISYD